MGDIPRSAAGSPAGAGAGSSSVVAPMPGKIVAVSVKVGQLVEAGDALIVMEAMKMEHTLRASTDSRVAEISCAAGEMIDDSTVLVQLEPA